MSNRLLCTRTRFRGRCRNSWSWSDDRPRCRASKIPDDVVYRPKTEIALEQHQRAIDNGIVFDWLTPDARKQAFVGEIPRKFRVWMTRPQITCRPYRKGSRGRGRKTPRLLAATPQTKTVEQYFGESPAFKDQQWEQWHVKDTQQGPKVVEVKRTIVYRRNEDGLPSSANHLLVVREVTSPKR